ncbi:MAG: tetratricopeptide repeat protein [Lentisphaerae bacterium]|nr:tetratricopeptide repeat protein [Lentisphaerota bacterium]
MAEVTLEQVPQKVKDLFNRGFAAFERGNLDYAIDMLMSCVELSPGLLRARKFLRAAEIQKKKKKPGNVVSDALLSVKGLPTYFVATARLKANKPEQALLLAEKLLRINPLHPKSIMLFAEASVAAGLPEAAIQTLEIARDFYPSHIKIINWLGQLYQKVGRTKSARECFEKLCEICPNDPGALKMLKDALAIDSMAADGWQNAADKGGTYRDIIKDTDEAHLLEQESKAVQTDRDTEVLIANTLKKIDSDPENINYYRQLSKLYAQKKAFTEAISALKKAISLNPGDPELDKTMSATRTLMFNEDIAQLKAAGDSDAMEAKVLERDQYIADDLQARVARYPNDPELRYEWGSLLFQYQHLNEAIQQFQISQRSPKYRIRSLYKLAMCFKQKGQHDLAIEQLEKAGLELTSMDQTKKDILYELGQITELTGDREKAAGYYKQIYQVDIGYKDIATKVEQVYKQ